MAYKVIEWDQEVKRNGGVMPQLLVGVDDFHVGLAPPRRSVAGYFVHSFRGIAYCLCFQFRSGILLLEALERPL